MTNNFGVKFTCADMKTIMGPRATQQIPGTQAAPSRRAAPGGRSSTPFSEPKLAQCLRVASSRILRVENHDPIGFARQLASASLQRGLIPPRHRLSQRTQEAACPHASDQCSAMSYQELCSVSSFTLAILSPGLEDHAGIIGYGIRCSGWNDETKCCIASAGSKRRGTLDPHRHTVAKRTKVTTNAIC